MTRTIYEGVLKDIEDQDAPIQKHPLYLVSIEGDGLSTALCVNIYDPDGIKREVWIEVDKAGIIVRGYDGENDAPAKMSIMQDAVLVESQDGDHLS